jgi:hypothetical protein
MSPLIFKNPQHFLFINDAADKSFMLDGSVANNLPDFPANLALKIRLLSKKIVRQICEFVKTVKPPFCQMPFLGKGEKHSSLFSLFFKGESNHIKAKVKNLIALSP